ncbi:MAG: 30S ribosomal protein S16 [Bacteroidetes bacterium]|nr:30S ribosomal protein S16 [Bacteroidota bacterium]
MPARIRLQRHGKKGKPFYHIVIADGRAPRDGKFIERIGAYNPLTKPATIDLDLEKALTWLKNGAQPTDTVRAIFSYKGVMYKHHLLKGVAKGALTVEQAEVKYQAWIAEKEAKIISKKNEGELALKNESKSRLEAEAKVKEKRADAISAKLAKAAAAAAKKASGAEDTEEEVEEATEEVVEETPVAEVAKEAPVADVVEEVVVEEAPAVEAVAEETPAAETTEEETPKAEA